MRLLQYIVVNTIAAILLYAATVLQIEGAKNIISVWIVVLFVCSLATFSADYREDMKKRGRSVPGFVDLGLDLSAVAVLLWHGWMVLGVLYLVHAALMHSAWSQIEKQQAKATGTP